MERKIVGICGHFGVGKNLVNGQTIKTMNFTNELEERLGKGNVRKVDSHNAKHHMLQIIKKCQNLHKECDKIICFPAHKGLCFFIPYFFWLNKIYKKDLYYVVIGGWLVNFLKKHRLIKFYLSKFNGIFVETKTMKMSLESMGIKNVSVIPNFKKMDCVKVDEIKTDFIEPYKICIFSRIEEQKGIEDAINVVTKINEHYGKVVYILDIYGPIQKKYEERFYELQFNFPKYINYCGVVQAENAAKIIKNYYFLLFPTRYYTEGIPGTIIDAYSAGVPVVSARWESFEDIVLESETGYGYNFCDLSSMYLVLQHVYDNPQECLAMRNRCVLEAKKYQTELVMDQFEAGLGLK